MINQMHQRMTRTDKVTIYTTDKIYDAEMARSYLADHNIDAFILNQKDSAYHFGEILLMVDRDDVIRSKMLMEEYINS